MAVNTGAFPPQSFKESQFLSLGLNLRSNGKVKAKRAVKLESQISDFQSVYGPHPRTLEAIWLDLHTTHFMELRIDPTVTPTQFLIVYRWMKAYESEKEMKTAFGFPEAYIRGWCKDITAKVAALRKIKVSTPIVFMEICLRLTQFQSSLDWPELARRWRVRSYDDSGWNPLQNRWTTSIFHQFFESQRRRERMSWLWNMHACS